MTPGSGFSGEIVQSPLNKWQLFLRSWRAYH